MWGKKATMLFTSGSLILALTACNTTVALEDPLQVSGPIGGTYNSDEAQCRAEARRVGQGHVGETAVIAGAGGALVGSLESSDNALIGGLLGAAAGAAVAGHEVRQAQRQYLVRCMQQRGHPVIG